MSRGNTATSCNSSLCSWHRPQFCHEMKLSLRHSPHFYTGSSPSLLSPETDCLTNERLCIPLGRAREQVWGGQQSVVSTVMPWPRVQHSFGVNVGSDGTNSFLPGFERVITSRMAPAARNLQLWSLEHQMCRQLSDSGRQNSQRCIVRNLSFFLNLWQPSKSDTIRTSSPRKTRVGWEDRSNSCLHKHTALEFTRTGALRILHLQGSSYIILAGGN